MIPQLRVRTEYNFRRTFGPIARVSTRLGEIGCPLAGIVDATGTWGHAAFERLTTCRAAFGREFASTANGACWALAEDTRAFYKFSSQWPQFPSRKDAEEAFAEARGLVRFAGALLEDPQAIDYVDINPRSLRRSEAALALAKRIKRPIVLTSDNDYPSPSDRAAYLAWNDAAKATPQHILDDAEMRAAFSFLDDRQFKRAVAATHEAAERAFCGALPKADLINVAGDFQALVSAGVDYRLKHGHITEWTDAYQQRLQRELLLIHEKAFESYFMVVADVVAWAKQRMLVGPARGSSAGSLVCYLLRITEVDPIVHGLLFERFIDINRADLPDIDIDFNDKKRDQVFAYLAEKYGAANVARVGSINRLKPRSVLAHVGKKMDIPHGATFSVTNALIEYSSGDTRYGKGLEDTLKNTQPGRDFVQRFPHAMIMSELENHASHSGVHAAGVIVSNRPVTEYCTVHSGVAQIDKRDAEHLALLKIDALGLRTLGLIEETGCVTPDQLYSLTLDDSDVFKIFNDGKYCGIFQFEGAAQRRVAKSIEIKSFQEIDHCTALARPGPFGGGACSTYINRVSGNEEIEYADPSLSRYLAETKGVVLYQEQVMNIVKDIGDFSWKDTSVIRKAMSGSKGKEFFDQYKGKFITGAAKHNISASTATEIWNEICSFGAWGMNKSHTASYAIISYWCAYMKRYYSLEYFAACLRNSKDDEQTIELLRELRDEGVPFVSFDPQRSDVDWQARDGMIIGGFTNLVGIGPAKANVYIKKRSENGLSETDLKALSERKVRCDNLAEAHALWADIYANPVAHGIAGPVKQIGELKDRENAVIIGKAIRLRRRDENEKLFVGKRGYEKTGQTLYLDLYLVDDSISKPITGRVRTDKWNAFGVSIADKTIIGKDWFLIRGRYLEMFSMITIDKIKCLTNPGMFNAQS